MSNITKFAGYPSATKVFLNYVGPITLNRISGDLIPSSAIIEKVTFSFYGDIWKGVNDNFWVHDLSYASEPDNNGNYWVDSADAPRISLPTKIDATSGNLLDTYEFTGIDETTVTEYNNYNALRILLTNTASFTVCFCRRKYRNPTTSTGSTGKVYTTEPCYCEVEWIDTNYEPTSPSNVTFTETSVYPGDSLTINWTPSTLPANASNSIIGYTINIYKTNSDINSEILGDYGPEEAMYPYYLAGATLSSYTFSAPTEAGTYYARVDTVTRDDEGSVGWWTNGSAYVPFTVKKVTSTGAPSNLQINYTINNNNYNTTSLYLGTTGIPELNFTWDAAPNGTNNKVDYYYLHRNNSLWKDKIAGTSFILSSTTNSVDDFIGNYSAYAQSTVVGYNSIEHSNIVSIEKISAIPSISFTRTYSGTISNDLTLSWTAASAINNATATYYIYYNNTLLASTTSTAYTFEITRATAGQNFTISVEPRYVTANGSYTPGAKITTGTLVRAAAFTVPTDFWQGFYDVENGFKSGIYSHAHKSIQISWNAITSNATNGTSFTYTLQYQINGGAFEKVADYTQASSIKQDISSFAEGTIIGYRMQIKNNYGIIVYSSVHTVTKIISPKITNLLINNVTATTLDCIFDWEYGSLATEDTKGLKYSVELEYDETPFMLVENGQIDQFTGPRVTLDNCDISINTLKNTLTSLYENVITNKKVYPKGKINLYLSQGSYASAYAEQSIEFTFNYITAPSALGIISYVSGKDYYNPGDTVKIQLTGFTWEDAAGGQNGGTATHYLTSSYSQNTFSFKNGVTTVTAPSASEDLSIVLTLKTSIAYAEVTKEYVSTSTLSFPVARWTSESVLIDSLNIVEDKTTGTKYLEGYVQLPRRLCSSQDPLMENLEKIVPSVVSPTGTDYTVKFYNIEGEADGSFITSDIPANYLIRFTIENTDQIYSDITAQFKFTFTNTSNSTLIIETNSYRYFLADIDMAVRKGRVGINVGANFATEEKSSTLQINAGSQTGTSPIVEILSTNQSTTDNKTQFLLLQDGSKSSAIWSDGENIFIDNLKTTVEGLTANRVLVSDANGKLAVSSSITTTELNRLNNVTSNVQTQLNSKQATITGAATTIVADNLAAGRVLISDDLGKVAASDITSTKLSYLSDVTSAIQAQLDAKYVLPTSITKNYVLAAPSSAAGAPAFRKLVAADIPNLNASKITAGTLVVERGGTGSGTKGATSGGALYNLGIVYADSTDDITSPYVGMICLVPKEVTQ